MSEEKAVQENLANVKELLAKHKLVEDLVRRQEMPRHELVEDMVHKQHPIGHDAWEYMDIDTAKLPKK